MQSIMNPRTWQSSFLNEPEMALMIIHESKTQQRDVSSGLSRSNLHSNCCLLELYPYV